ncbi:DUF305 domain-containing protein [Nocardia sp. Marseille-Q1738]
MIRNRWIGAAALGGLALLLLVMGAALGPTFLPGKHRPLAILDDAEIGFIQDMVAHHNQALLMVQRLDPAADPTVRTLARQIADTQRTEIGMFLGWLRLAGTSTTNPRPMAWMHRGQPNAAGHHAGAPQHTDGRMPGMASRAELDALAAARGTQAEIQFLRLMQRHHHGGIQMARAVDDLLVGGVVKQSARDMISTQGQEVGLMVLLLSQRAA